MHDTSQMPEPPIAGQPNSAAAVSATPAPLHRKIARLPQSLRDQINTMLDQSMPAHEIITALEQSTDPVLPYPISEMNISDWKNTGYQKYLAHQQRIAVLDANRESALQIVAQADTTTLPEATLQIIASQYYEFLSDFSPASLKAQLGEDPLKYTRFLNVFARLVREIVHLRKHRQTGVNSGSSKPKPFDVDRDLSDLEYQMVIDKMDRIFRIARRHRSSKPAAADKS